MFPEYIYTYNCSSENQSTVNVCWGRSSHVHIHLYFRRYVFHIVIELDVVGIYNNTQSIRNDVVSAIYWSLYDILMAGYDNTQL